MDLQRGPDSISMTHANSHSRILLKLIEVTIWSLYETVSDNFLFQSITCCQTTNYFNYTVKG